MTPSMTESIGTNNPNYTVGLRVNIPLEQGIAAKAREGYRVQAQSQDIAFRRRAYESEREWLDLERKFSEGKYRLTLATKLEDAQRAKLDLEKKRLTRGRTTTYQVILFEEDFANAQLNRIRMQADVLGVYSQMKAFGGAQ
jgi:outer membrane protein TolC